MIDPTAVQVFQADLPSPARGVFTTRQGGTSPDPWRGANLALHTGDDPARIAALRARLAGQLGVVTLAFGQQVHGAGVRFVTTSGPQAAAEGLPGTDGLVTTTPGLGLVMMGADCLPVLLADPVAPVVGVAHVGRQGLAAGVLRELLRVMAEHGGQASRTAASIGPGICGGCYEVSLALADQVGAAVPGSRATTRRGTPSLDLAAGAWRQLEVAGVPDARRIGGCTAEQPDLFFSYRRDGVTGRQGGVAWLT